MRIERRRGKRAPTGGQVARGRCAPELVSQRAELIQEIVAGEKTTREESGRALRRVPGAEVLDHRLRMHSRLGILRELTHRRRASEPFCGGAKLLEDLVVRVATAQARAKCGEFRLVDAQRATLACARSSHTCN